MLVTINRKNIGNHLLEYQLELVGRQMIDLLDDEAFRFNWTITKAQLKIFREYAIPLLKKTFKCNKSKAEITFEWFLSEFGLRVKG
jgi:hypothetical protein